MKWSELDKAAKNALVAEKVMGLKVQWLNVVPSLPPVAVIVDESEIVKGNPPDYCEDMNAAMSALLHLEKDFRIFYTPVVGPFLERKKGHSFSVEIELSISEPEVWGRSTDNLMEAIVIACLKAVGVEIES